MHHARAHGRARAGHYRHVEVASWVVRDSELTIELQRQRGQSQSRQ